MPAHGKSKFFLLQKFQDFYTEIIRLKQQAQVGVLSVAVAAGSEAAPSAAASNDHTATEIWNAVAGYLDREMVDVARSGTSMLSEVYRELLYVMAAVADEVFVHLQWEGQQYWLAHLLEARFFRSHVAGERIFRNIQSVLVRQDQAAEELAAVYLTVLALGFRGQYWGSEDSSAIEKDRRELLLYLARSNPRLLDDSKRLFADAYRYTLQDGVPAQLPNPARWWFVAASVVLAWLVISTVCWFILTQETRDAIRNANSALGAISTSGAVTSASPEASSTLAAPTFGSGGAQPEQGVLRNAQSPNAGPVSARVQGTPPNALQPDRTAIVSEQQPDLKAKAAR